MVLKWIRYGFKMVLKRLTYIKWNDMMPLGVRMKQNTYHRERHKMTIEEMKERKKELGYSNRELSDRSGVPIGTLQKIFGGSTESPRKDTIEALERALAPRYDFRTGHYDSSVLREPAPSYKVAEAHTIDDYMALPDDQRVELIDGVFYEMLAPVIVHQGIAGYVHSKLLQFVTEHKGKCFPMIAPVDVQLDCDQWTMVQPDVLILCDLDKIGNRKRVYGAPEFVLEILSPSTRKKDMVKKLQKYSDAGVQEYWIIDPEKKVLIQYDLRNDEIPRIYNFEESVPVLIWNSACQIDLKDMYESLSFLWDEE